MNEAYTPVSCEQHSEYELAIMHGKTLEVSWQDKHGRSQKQSLKPYDIVTEHKAEYLLGKDSLGEDKKIRLDKITEAQSTWKTI